MNGWNNFNDGTIGFRKPFSDKYTLLIDSDSKGVNVTMQSKTQMRWDFRVLNVTQSEVEIELLLLDNVLLETNNPIMKDLSAMSQVFGRMYNELHLIINRQGQIVNILNLSLIQEKWKRAKQEMEAVIHEHPELKDVIVLSDAVFQSPERIARAIKGSEFFMLYFRFFFGTTLRSRNQSIQLPNVLNTAFVDWLFNWWPDAGLATDTNQVVIVLQASPAHLSERWYQEAYKSFAHLINIRQLRTSLSEKGLFRFDNRTGQLLEAEVVKEEVADKELFCKVTYRMVANTYAASKNPAGGEQTKTAVSENAPKRKSFWGWE